MPFPKSLQQPFRQSKLVVGAGWRAFFANYNKALYAQSGITTQGPTILDMTTGPFNSYTPPTGWTDLGWIKDFKATVESKIGQVRSGYRRKHDTTSRHVRRLRRPPSAYTLSKPKHDDERCRGVYPHNTHSHIAPDCAVHCAGARPVESNPAKRLARDDGPSPTGAGEHAQHMSEIAPSRAATARVLYALAEREGRCEG